MRLAGLTVPASGDDSPRFDDDSAHCRIGAGVSNAALRQLNRLAHETFIDSFGSHAVLVIAGIMAVGQGDSRRARFPVAVHEMRRYTLPMHAILESLLQVWFHWMHDWGFWGIVLLMAMESSIFPVPSEIVVPPAAILAADKGVSGLAMVWFAAVLGSWLGSAVTYWVALQVGRPAVMKYGGYIFMPPAKVERAERFMHRYEGGAIFFARLLPVIRHLISIPAGIIRMGFAKFSLLTIVGSAIWCAVLVWLGERVGQVLPADQMQALKAGSGVQLRELIHAVKGGPFHVILGAIIAVCVLYFVMMRLTGKQSEAEESSKETENSVQ
jgi:membrane protein DedA with SNARE-associated domain